MAATSLSRRGQFSTGAAPTTGGSSGSRTMGSSAPDDNQVPQPHSLRPPSGTCTSSPHVLQRIFGMGGFSPFLSFAIGYASKNVNPVRCINEHSAPRQTHVGILFLPLQGDVGRSSREVHLLNQLS